MSHSILLNLTLIAALGVGAQWLAWRFKLSPVLLLLGAGFLVGPVMGLLNPSELFGALLFPGVSLAVAIILFEGGLSLKLSELSEFGKPIFRLLTWGTLITWIGISLSAYLIFHLPITECILLGAILSVTGPTVIQPLLNHSRPSHATRTVLNWEGIIIDPIGAMLAVIVFEVMHVTYLYNAPLLALKTVLSMIIWGVVCGGAMAYLITFLLKQFWLPDSLHSPFSFVAVLTAFTAANSLQEEAGLIAVTVMGMYLANQSSVGIQHIVHFKENMRVLLLSGLFIVLAARLDLNSIIELGIQGLIFVAVLILLVRPIAVIVSTYKTDLRLNEKLFIGWMAPRGIVAAAVSSILTIKLQQAHLMSATTSLLEPITYVVIIGTVVIYSFSAIPTARWLKIRQAEPNGVLIVGATPWARELGKLLRQHQIPIQFIDSNRKSVYRTRLEGLPVHYGSSLSEYLHEELEFEEMGYLLALTSNDEVNRLTAMKFQEHFGRSSVYQLMPLQSSDSRKNKVTAKLSGRFLFNEQLTFEKISSLYEQNHQIKATLLTETFTYQDFITNGQNPGIPLLFINSQKELQFLSSDSPVIEGAPGTIVVSLKKKEEKMSNASLLSTNKYKLEIG